MLLAGVRSVGVQGEGGPYVEEGQLLTMAVEEFDDVYTVEGEDEDE